ncbi:MAG: hypothetical protein KGH59_01440 [Candidatus Micrarchaeota archaeon]|nr:hypothetical protein [Candidatus Micrarchaeota archaeon]MDE1804429.1 hypothetical protein [Candidatus Micrarchaeota archaeon]MDE1847203.1 hypothetical protein [Candidatus Micrarchaeota archaeon]
MNTLNRNRIILVALLSVVVLAVLAYKLGMVGVFNLNQIASKQNALYGIGDASAFNKSAMLSGMYPDGNGYWVENFYSVGFFPIGNSAGPVIVPIPARFANSSLPYQVEIRVEYSNTTHAIKEYDAALFNATYKIPNVGIGDLLVRNASLGSSGFRKVNASFAAGRYFVTVSAIGSAVHLNQSFAQAAALHIYYSLNSG